MSIRNLRELMVAHGRHDPSVYHFLRLIDQGEIGVEEGLCSLVDHLAREKVDLREQLVVLHHRVSSTGRLHPIGP